MLGLGFAARSAQTKSPAASGVFFVLWVGCSRVALQRWSAAVVASGMRSGTDAVRWHGGSSVSSGHIVQLAHFNRGFLSLATWRNRTGWVGWGAGGGGCGSVRGCPPAIHPRGPHVICVIAFR
jgi:hypothetical protein